MSGNFRYIFAGFLLSASACATSTRTTSQAPEATSTTVADTTHDGHVATPSSAQTTVMYAQGPTAPPPATNQAPIHNQKSCDFSAPRGEMPRDQEGCASYCASAAPGCSWREQVSCMESCRQAVVRGQISANTPREHWMYTGSEHELSAPNPAIDPTLSCIPPHEAAMMFFPH